MSEYLPQHTFVVCSNQVNSSPNKLLADSNSRELTVSFASKKEPLLTVVDMSLEVDFECKNNWGTAAVWSFLVAGAALGLAVAFSVCTFGVGAVILGAAAIAATVIVAKSNSTKCNPNLIKWVNEHPKVNFNKHKAVVKQSFITCSVDASILKPFLDEEQAKSAARRIAIQNMGEISLSAIISGMFGFAIGYSGGSAIVAEGGTIGLGLLAAGNEGAIGVAGAYLIYQPISNIEKGIMRNIWEEDGNTEYDKMVAERRKNESTFTVDSPDDPYIGSSQTDMAGELKDASFDLYRQKQNRRYINDIMKLEGTKNERKAATEKIAKEMSRTRSGAEAVNKMRRVQSGEILQRTKTQTKGEGVINQHTAQTKLDMKNSLNEGLVGSKEGTGMFKGANAVGLLLPLFITPLSEWTLNILANADNSKSGGVSIQSIQH